MIVLAVLMGLQLLNVVANVAGGFPVIGRGRLRGQPSVGPADGEPVVSLLVPARNEAANIEACVRSLLAQRLGSFEVVVIDDGSTDETGSIVAALAANDGRLRLRTSSGPPAGWSGKNHACHQLAAEAGGSWLVFVDADVTLVPDTVAEMITLAEGGGYDLISGLPRAEGGTRWATWVTSAMASFMLLGAPMWLLNGRAKRAGGLAMGQVLCFRREAYEAIGGHATVRGSLLEDISFSVEMQRAQRPTAFVNLTRAVRADLFPTFSTAWVGVARWFQCLAEISVLGTAIAATAGMVLYLLPWVALALGLRGAAGDGAPISLAAGLLGILAVVIVDRAARRPPWMVMLQPVVLFLWLAAFLVGLTRRIRRTPARWRGREYTSTGTAP